MLNENILKTLRLICALALIASMALVLGSCEGPVGPSGRDVEGVDVIPPTVVLTSPWPISEVWDNFSIKASAVDNVAIREISFLVDGTNYYNGQSLMFYEPPFEADLNVDSSDTGWHFLSARGFDTAGNATETAPIPVYFGFSNDLQDTLVTKNYYSADLSNITSWHLPDSSHALAYWSRFSIARNCQLMSCSVMLAGAISDTDSVAIGIWNGDEFPETALSQKLIPGSSLTESLNWQVVDFGEEGLRITDDFFILISLRDHGIADTISVASDQGIPFWNRSGSLDEIGYDSLKGRYARKDNFIVSCGLYYEPIAGGAGQ